MVYLLNWKYVFLLFMLIELVMITIHMFSQGFLLKRDVLRNRSKCNEFTLPCMQNESSHCYLPPKFSKVVLVIIDALRYDFTSFNSHITKDKQKPFQNKMKIFQELLTFKPQQSKLFKFVADPPTTTMQRLKGLTTGSLPTFLDASHNFASGEVDEDNLIDQIIQTGKKITILGDDTWGDLYPKRFHRSFLFPSFNVMDLDSVDNGILEHLFTEISSPTSDFIIAHFLGVDHCGHRYGPLHPQMDRKLSQMNNVIKNVSRMMSKDSLMIVVGDHGMTSTGDHGGDSKAEIETALFFFSPGLNLPSLSSQHTIAVAQIDLVPTLAYLFGIPIPYSNLGKIIEDIVDFSESSSCSLDDILFMNYQQVNRYLHTYQSLNQEFPKVTWEQLNSLSLSINDSLADAKHKKLVVQFLTLARNMCEEIWAKFNVFHIVLGLISFSCILIFIINILPKKESASYLILQNFSHILILFIIANTAYGVSFLFSPEGWNLIICFTIVFGTGFYFNAILPFGFNLFAIISVLIISFGSFSNSFVIVEDSVSSFIFLSFILLLMVKYLYRKLNFYIKRGSFLSLAEIVLLCCVFVIFLCIRCSRIFLKCREEQHWCDSSSLVHIPLNGLPQKFHNTRYFSSIFSLVVLILVPRIWLQRCGNLNSWEINVMVAKTFPILCSLLTAAFWALQCIPSIPENISKVVTHLPQVVYLIAVIGIFAIFYNPLLIYTLSSSLSSNILRTSESSIIPQLFMKLKQTYEHRSNDPRKIPVVYGLATSISAPMTVVFSLVAFSIIIISGDGMTPGILLLVSGAVFTLIFHCFLTWNDACSVENLLAPNWCSVALWFLLSIHGFYATGHQAAFSSLNWSSAFVGYDGTGSYVIPAALVIINTFSSQLLFGMALPLLLIVPLSIGFLWPPIRHNKIEEVGHRGEFILVERHVEAKESLLSIAILYMAFHFFKVLFTSVAAFLLRRHLMVWKIFAPHFIFESVGLVVSSLGVLFGLVFIFRVISSFECWSKKM